MVPCYSDCSAMAEEERMHELRENRERISELERVAKSKDAAVKLLKESTAKGLDIERLVEVTLDEIMVEREALRTVLGNMKATYRGLSDALSVAQDRLDELENMFKRIVV